MSNNRANPKNDELIALKVIDQSSQTLENYLQSNYTGHLKT